MKHFLSSFKRLQWKLTLSYALTTALVLLLIEIMVIIAAFVYTNMHIPEFLVSTLRQEAVQVTPYFVRGATPDQKELSSWLRLPAPAYVPGTPVIQASLTVVDRQGQVIAAYGSNTVPAGSLLQSLLPKQSAAYLQMVLTGKSQGQVDQLSNGILTVIVPIEGSDGKVQGALVQNTVPHMLDQQNGFWIAFYLRFALSFLLVISIISGTVGIIFGFVTTRGFTRRFKRLSSGVDNWSQGDFSTFVKDTSGDEVGQLARRLNRMAEQLQNLLQTRQRLTSLEERNRLARDLHDSVKQHIFVAGLQVGAAKIQLGQREIAVQQRLGEAEGILQQVQQELATLIHELRPVVVEEKGLNAALQALAAQLDRQTGIAVSIQIEGESQQALPPQTEEALFRVTQEALAYVIRHSQATCVQVHLVYLPDKVMLSISDNGRGFDTTLVQGNGAEGVGLISMHERVAAIGGEMRVESTAGTGTSVIVSYAREHMIV
jgi:signal transduction histidine kinase